jgi:hypothetical protein
MRYALHVANCSSATTWQPGQRYGFPLLPIQTVPKGFFLAKPGATAPLPTDTTRAYYILFQPDGSASGSADLGLAFDLVEALKKPSPQNRVKFTVDASGRISYE